MIKRVEFALIALVIAFLIPLAGASVIFKQPNAIYNVGDELNTKLDVSSLEDTNEFLSADLICGSKSSELLKVPLKINAGEQKSQEIIVDLDKTVLDGLTGECFLRAVYGAEVVESRKFQISDKISLNFDSVLGSVNPGESLKVSGKATKENGELLNGIASLSVDGLNVYQTVSVNQGIFSINFSVPGNSKSIDYNVKVSVYDKDKNGDIMSSGSSNLSFKVKPVLTKMDIVLSESNVNPGESLVYTAFALDQAGDYMKSEGKLVVSSSIGVVEEKLIQTSQAYQINTQLNTTVGQWKISVSSQNISSEKYYNVEEYEGADFNVLGNILTITNLGNVIYDKPVQVTIGNSKVIVNDTYVQIGSSKTYELEAPDGEYEVSAGDGASSKILGRSFLTGEVVAVNDPNSKGFVNLTTWIWIIVILVLGGLAFVYYNKVAKKSYYGATPRHVNVLSSTSKADTIQYGNKENASIFALKIKNYDTVKGNENVKGLIQEIVARARKSGGYIEHGIGGTFLVIFTKAMTKQEDNTLSTVEFGKGIVESMIEYNSKAVSKIDFGAGVNNGELIVEYRGGLLKYNSVGNAVFMARKIADSSDNSLVIGDSVHAITRARVKVERAMHGWKVSNIKDNSKHSEFINRFMQRQKTGSW